MLNKKRKTRAILHGSIQPHLAYTNVPQASEQRVEAVEVLAECPETTKITSLISTKRKS